MAKVSNGRKVKPLYNTNEDRKISFIFLYATTTLLTTSGLKLIVSGGDSVASLE